MWVFHSSYPTALSKNRHMAISEAVYEELQPRLTTAGTSRGRQRGERPSGLVYDSGSQTFSVIPHFEQGGLFNKMVGQA